MKNTKNCVFFAFWVCLAGVHAGPSWGRYLAKPDDWFRSEQGQVVLENILSWQDKYGSWPKNTDTASRRFSGDRDSLQGTFDNGATTREMRMLARAYRATGRPAYRDAFLKGLDLILKAQYPTGGWPQYYPPPQKSYHRHITFNDGAMVMVMELLREIANEPQYDFVDKERRKRAQEAFDNGVECILNCQVVVNGRRTVWCAQHDETDFSPCQGRSYELVSLSGGESVGILQLLMSLEPPSPAVVEAITSAVRWYCQSRIEGVRVVMEDDIPRVVCDPDAPPLWARFYEIETNRPLFSNRDGKPLYDFNLVVPERSSGYKWLGEWGEDVFDGYQRWREKWQDRLDIQLPSVAQMLKTTTACSIPCLERASYSKGL